MWLDLHDIWRWVTHHKAGDFGGIVVAGEEIFRLLVSRARKRDEAQVLKVLQMGGGSGWGLTDEQVAMQCGWEPRKARWALRRLARAGKVQGKDQRWYLAGPVPSILAKPESRSGI